jgi:predicted metal-dependent phosphoesterase TrpH
MATRTLRADLHCHTYYSPDALTSPGKFVAACLERDINCVAITDHNTIEGALLMRRVCPFQVIVGEEVRTQEGDLIGLFLEQAVPPHLSLEETVERIKAQGGLVMVPHPFDRFRRSIGEDGLRRILPAVDLIEVFNARAFVSADNERARRFAEEHGIPGVAVSDTHSPREVGRAFMELPAFDGPESFLAAVRQARLVQRPSSPLVHMASRWAVLRRQLLGWQPTGS